MMLMEEIRLDRQSKREKLGSLINGMHLLNALSANLQSILKDYNKKSIFYFNTNGVKSYWKTV